MKAHVQIVAVLHIALGILSLLGAIAIFFIFCVATAVVTSQGDHQAGGITAIVGFALAVFLTVLSLPGILGGWALYTGRPWGRPVILVLSILHVVNFPFGTALGVYTFWALFKESPPSLPRPTGIQAAS